MSISLLYNIWVRYKRERDLSTLPALRVLIPQVKSASNRKDTTLLQYSLFLHNIGDIVCHFLHSDTCWIFVNAWKTFGKQLIGFGRHLAGIQKHFGQIFSPRALGVAFWKERGCNLEFPILNGLEPLWVEFQSRSSEFACIQGPLVLHR